jgi:hypothetical protein
MSARSSGFFSSSSRPTSDHDELAVPAPLLRRGVDFLFGDKRNRHRQDGATTGIARGERGPDDDGRHKASQATKRGIKHVGGHMHDAALRDGDYGRTRGGAAEHQARHASRVGAPATRAGAQVPEARARTRRRHPGAPRPSDAESSGSRAPTRARPPRSRSAAARQTGCRPERDNASDPVRIDPAGDDYPLELVPQPRDEQRERAWSVDPRHRDGARSRDRRPSARARVHPFPARSMRSAARPARRPDGEAKRTRPTRKPAPHDACIVTNTRGNASASRASVVARALSATTPAP